MRTGVTEWVVGDMLGAVSGWLAVVDRTAEVLDIGPESDLRNALTVGIGLKAALE